jgi:hypothetical protein
MIFLKCKRYDDSKQYMINLKYIVMLRETEERRKIQVSVNNNRAWELLIQRDSIKFIEIEKSEDGFNCFLSEEDMEL